MTKITVPVKCQIIYVYELDVELEGDNYRDDDLPGVAQDAAFNIVEAMSSEEIKGKGQLENIEVDYIEPGTPYA